MTSFRQIDANRRNARQSADPTTLKGKQRCCPTWSHTARIVIFALVRSRYWFNSAEQAARKPVVRSHNESLTCFRLIPTDRDEYEGALRCLHWLWRRRPLIWLGTSTRP